MKYRKATKNELSAAATRLSTGKVEVHKAKAGGNDLENFAKRVMLGK